MTATIGHNNTRAGGVAADHLRSIIERVEKLESDKADIAIDIREVLSEAKGNGYSVPTIKQILKLRKKDASEREEEETLLEAYMKAMGMLPLFDESEES